MAERRPRRSISQAFLIELLTRQLRDQAAVGAGAELEIIDLGGGTGLVASELAARGHRVTVIDPSPDALASLERRTADAGLAANLRGIQGDAAGLTSLIGPAAVDLVVCHRVLEVLDAPADALAAVATVLRPGGRLSLLVSQRPSAVLAQALSGHFAQARRTFADPARFDYHQVVSLVEEAGFAVLDTHGVGAVADHVPETFVDSDPGAYADLLALEADVSQDPAFRVIAAQVHVLARRP